jgi:succinate dehydrogenase/fumarate reductase flavoprotein subunit
MVSSCPAIHQGNSGAWIVLGSSQYEALVEFNDKMGFSGYASGDPIVADSAEELAELIGAPALADTIETYNKYAEQGTDPVCNRCTDNIEVLDPPYYAGQVKPTGYTAYPHGELDISVNGEVLDASGNVIPGLFAAGRCARTTSEGYSETGTGMGCIQGLVVGHAIGLFLSKQA